MFCAIAFTKKYTVKHQINILMVCVRNFDAYLQIWWRNLVLNLFLLDITLTWPRQIVWKSTTKIYQTKFHLSSSPYYWDIAFTDRLKKYDRNLPSQFRQSSSQYFWDITFTDEQKKISKICSCTRRGLKLGNSSRFEDGILGCLQYFLFEKAVCVRESKDKYCTEKFKSNTKYFYILSWRLFQYMNNLFKINIYKYDVIFKKR